jgi:hypothetical protein
MENNKSVTAVEWLEQEIDKQQKSYIDLAKKDKSLKIGVDAILTATTLLKLKCNQAKEMESEKNKKFDEMLEMLQKCKEYFLLKTDAKSEERADAIAQLIEEATKL